jgi:AraC-like DNA-binding protein
MNFKKYPKVHRLGKDETDGILFGTVHVEEKLDGSNVQIWLEEGELQFGTRNQRITEGFNGFVEYCKADPAITKLFSEHPMMRIYGEWLVRHTISYNETAYKQFYLFDATLREPNLTEDEREEFMSREAIKEIADRYGFKTPQYHGSWTNPTEEEFLVIKALAGLSALGDKGEGIVLKNEEFRDKFGNHNHAKIVTEAFKEDNGVTFGGNNKHSDTYWEMYIVNKYMTLARIEKIMHKLQPEIDEKLDLKHIPRITNTAYHDMLTEEIWEIAKKVGTVNFKSLKRVALKKAVQIYKDKLSGDISVADRSN